LIGRRRRRSDDGVGGYWVRSASTKLFRKLFWCEVSIRVGLPPVRTTAKSVRAGALHVCECLCLCDGCSTLRLASCKELGRVRMPQSLHACDIVASKSQCTGDHGVAKPDHAPPSKDAAVGQEWLQCSACAQSAERALRRWLVGAHVRTTECVNSARTLHHLQLDSKYPIVCSWR
jgi:hypothetical protein